MFLSLSRNFNKVPFNQRLSYPYTDMSSMDSFEVFYRVSLTCYPRKGSSGFTILTVTLFAKSHLLDRYKKKGQKPIFQNRFISVPYLFNFVINNQEFTYLLILLVIQHFHRFYRSCIYSIPEIILRNPPQQSPHRKSPRQPHLLRCRQLLHPRKHLRRRKYP